MSRKKTQISELKLEKIGGRIAYIRLTNNLSQAQFSEKTGLSRGNVSGLESHKYEPSYKAITTIIDLFDVDSNWLLFGIESKEKREKPKQKALSKTTLKHQKLITEFEDPEEGLDVNRKLIELQNTNKSLFKSAIQSVVGFWSAAMEVKNAQSGNSFAPGSGSDNVEENRQKIQTQPKGAKKNGTAG